nr:hypothetical protein [uncultured Flavobacterium sp.]
MKILIIHKEPIIDRIPNLKSFIVSASDFGHKITIITTKNKVYSKPTFLTSNIKHITVEERSRKLQIPTFIRFYALCFFIITTNIFQKYSLVLAGKYALAFGSLIKFKKYCSFIIEYPELNFDKRNELSLFDKLELKGIKNSDFLVTHDKLHADFISQKIGIENLKFTTIPNGTIGKAKKEDSSFLHKRLGFSLSQKILLHSGGFGPWFDSIALAQKSSILPSNIDLVFHVSHDISEDDYYKAYLKQKKNDEKIFFSMKAVETNKLDELISSAYIGIAWYSTDVLGYRATMLGLSAGKIGNYLKCGIPVIVPNYDSLDYISKFSCGKQISNLENLNEAIIDIEQNYAVYSQNAVSCYNELWDTEKYCDVLLDKLTN